MKSISRVSGAPVSFVSYVVGSIASIGGLLFGWDTGQISDLVIMDDFKQRFSQGPPGEKDWTPWIKGLVVSLLSAGAILGAAFGAPVADRFGRKYAISLGCIVYFVALIIQISSEHDWAQIAVGRAVDGFGIGWISATVPLYNSEIMPRQVRGAMVGSYQLCVTLGLLLSYCCCYATHKYGDSGEWRVPIGVGFGYGLILCLGILVCPESPRWLAKKGKFEQAKKVLAFMRGVGQDDKFVNDEYTEIKTEVEKEAEMQEGNSWLDCFSFKHKALYRTLMAVLLQMGQQLTGANYFFYYGATIFAPVELVSDKEDNSYIAQIILGAVNVFTTLPGLYALDKFGRRTCLLVGAAWMTIWLIVFSTAGVCGHDDGNPGNVSDKSIAILMICSACFFILGFASTWGPGVWSSVAELAVPQLRAKQMALATMSNWTWNFNLAFFTSPITDDIHFYYGYVFVGCVVAFFLIVFFFLYETANLDLETVQLMFMDSSVKPWNSAHWVPSGRESRSDLKHDIEYDQNESDFDVAVNDQYQNTNEG